MTNGIIYVTYGKKYVEAAIYSAKSTKKHCPNLNIHLFVDAPNYELFNFEEEAFPFTSVEIIENPHRRSKVDCISKSPYERTLFLDSDTMVVQDISDIFLILDRYDIAAAHAMHRNLFSEPEIWNIQLPNAFPQFNSGVLLFRKTAHVTELLENWSAAFSDSKLRHDQPTFRELLWLSDLQIAILPPEYNVRHFRYPLFWSKTEAQTKVFHLKLLHKGFRPWFKTTIKKMSGIHHFRKFQKVALARFQTKIITMPNLNQIKTVIALPIKKLKGRKKL
jgi:lipopolysaccharide biosynthesis glycosyltransferase